MVDEAMVMDTDKNYNPYQSPIDVKDSTMLFITNPEEEIHKLELIWRGMYETENGEIKRYGKPLMNDYGVQSLISLVRSVVSQINILGQENEREINAIMLDYIDVLIKTLMVKWQEFGIERENRSLILIQAKYPPYFALKRSLNEGERRFWGKIQQEVKHIVQSDNRNRGGILSKMFNFGMK